MRARDSGPRPRREVVKMMPMRRSTVDWIDKRDRAWRRRCYLRCLDKHLKELDEAASATPRLAEVCALIKGDLSNLESALP